jgi:ribonuclease HI
MIPVKIFSMYKHVEECVTKSIRSLWAARSMIARTWGLNPYTTAWLYNQIILPRVTYGSIIWWHRANLKTYSQKLNKIHRQALLMITGATRSTPTLGMSAALELFPLNIMIESRAIESYERLKLFGTWNAGAEDFGHGKIANNTENENSSSLQDRCTKAWNFGKEFKTDIKVRNEWNYNLENTKEAISWYSDGSKKDGKTGSGMCCEQLQISRSERLSDHSTVMQAEVTAIKLCAEMSIEKNLINKDIYIFSDSQAAVMAINKSYIYSLTVKSCVQTLNELGRGNRLTIAWVPGHSGIEGNEKADELANQGTSKENIGIVTPIPNAVTANRSKEKRIRMFRDVWNNIRGLMHSKLMMEPFKKGKNYTTKLKRKDLRVLIGMLTGHACLKKYLYRIGKSENPFCEFCGEEEEEDIKHIITRCARFLDLRRKLFGSALPEEHMLKDIKHSVLLKFAKASGIYDTFFRKEQEHTERANEVEASVPEAGSVQHPSTN